MDNAPTPAATRSSLDALRQVAASVHRWRGAEHLAERDELVAEEPLELRRAATDSQSPETIATIMRTPGHDEELAAGFLYSEGLVRAREELAGFRPGLDDDGLPSPNTLDVLPAPGVRLAERLRDGAMRRAFAVNASCGVCGRASVTATSALFPAVATGLTISPQTLYGLPEQLRAGQSVFSATGGLHAAGLFTVDGTLLRLREDVGRHNAVDKLLGRALLDGALPLTGNVLLVSGRVSFEIVQKALAASVPVLAAVSAPSSLAVDLAREAGITLVAFLRGASLNVYTHPERIRPA